MNRKAAKRIGKGGLHDGLPSQEELVKRVAIRLKEWRENAKLTQEEVGNMCTPRVPGSAISRIESGTGNPKLGLLVKLSSVLGVTLDELLGIEKVVVPAVDGAIMGMVDEEMRMLSTQVLLKRGHFSKRTIEIVKLCIRQDIEEIDQSKQ